MTELGVDPQAIAQQKALQAGARHQEDSSELEIWPWHIAAMRVFDAMQTQWVVVAGMTRAVHIGLNYPALQTVVWGLGLEKEDPQTLFRQVRVMEQAGLKHLNG